MKSLCLNAVNRNLTDESSGFVSVVVSEGIVIEISGSISTFDADKTLDITGGRLFSGFIDIHNHGAVGVDVNTATVEDLFKVSQFLAGKGVTAWLPTFVPDSVENYQTVIDAIDEVMRTQDARDEIGARILGVHYEGIFANEKMCGALRPQYFRTFKNGDELSDIPKIKTPNAIHLTTLAPEIEGGIELIRELRRQGWIVSIGHTRADAGTLERAQGAGASHVTHLFNAMTGIHHRDLGVAGWALTNPAISCEIIADGIHVHPKMLKFAWQNKTAEKMALVSDSVAPTGLGDGSFELWGEKILVVNGRTENERGSIAGSVITMLDAVRQMLALGIPADEVSKMASLVPSRILGIGKEYGSIEIGKRADFVALDDDGHVLLSVVGGRIVK